MLYAAIMLMSSADLHAEECSISLSESKIDLGRIIRPESNTTSNLNGMYDLPPHSVRLRVTCANIADLGLHIRDSAGAGMFKFSQHGKMLMNARGALLDGRSIELSTLAANSHGLSVEVGAEDMLIPVINGIPAKGKVWTVTFDLLPTIPVHYLHSAEALTPRAQISFELLRR
jgi:hypothetical protein